MSATLPSLIDLLASLGIVIDCFHLESWFLVSTWNRDFFPLLINWVFFVQCSLFYSQLALWIWRLKERYNVDFGILNLESLIDQLW